LETFLHQIVEYGYWGLFVSMTLSIIGVPIPGESILTFAGYLTFQKNFHIIPTIISASLGGFTGFTISFFLGRILSGKLLHKSKTFPGISESRLTKTKKWLEHYGSWLFIFGYFIPGVRHLTAIVAGGTQIKYSKFALFAALGGLLWSLTFILLGYYMGKKRISIITQIHNHILIITLIILVLLILYFIFRTKKSNKKINIKVEPQ